MGKIKTKDKSIKVSGKVHKILRKKAFLEENSIKDVNERLVMLGIDVEKEKA